MSPLITKAKAALILDQPFFAALLLGMDMVETESVPTMATDGDRILINPVWTAKLTLPEVTFVLAHEVLHCVFQHMFRLRERNPKRWNVATDYIINDLLITEGCGRMPAMGLHNPQLVAEGKGTADGVYDLLPDDTSDQPMDELMEPGGQPGDQPGEGSGPGEGPDGPGGQVPGPGHGPGAGTGTVKRTLTQAELSQKQSEHQVKIQQAKAAAEAAGKLSEGMRRMVEQATKPVVDWRSALRRFLSERTKSDVTYARPKRRFAYSDMILPSRSGERLGRVTVAVDCSGSIDDRTLQAFQTEVRGIVEDVCPDETQVIYFTSKVCGSETFTPDMPIVLTNEFSGGTAFSPVFEFIAEQDVQPVCVVFLTDLDCGDFGPAPEYPVLWASTAYDSAPFGEVIPISKESL